MVETEHNSKISVYQDVHIIGDQLQCALEIFSDFELDLNFMKYFATHP